MTDSEIISENKLTDPVYTDILEQYKLADVESLIRLKDVADIKTVRQNLLQVIFSSNKLPIGLVPQTIKTKISDPVYKDTSNLSQIDRLEFNMNYGINSIMYHFHAEQPNNRLIVYNHGHRGGFNFGKETISGFLNNGYDVIAISMPLKGKNSRPVVNIEGIGALQLKDHNWMQFLDTPLSFFMKPINVAVEYGFNTGYKNISLVGLSAGGWAVTVYGAIDERIKNTFQVAGTMPFFLRSAIPGQYKGHLGDFEQHYLPLLKAANYLELYILGSVGKDRRQVQIINQFDSVAAHGIKYRLYESIVQQRVQSIGNGGGFEVFLDSKNPHHSISENVLAYILNSLK